MISIEIKKGFPLDIEFNAKLRCIYIEQDSSQRVVVEKKISTPEESVYYILYAYHLFELKVLQRER